MLKRIPQATIAEYYPRQTGGGAGANTAASTKKQ